MAIVLIPPASMFASFTFRWTLAVCFVLLFQSVVVSGIFWWNTSHYAASMIELSVVEECGDLKSLPLASLLRTIAMRGDQDLHRKRYAALFDLDGTVIAGNLARIPAGLPVDGAAHQSLVDRSKPVAALDTGIVSACHDSAGRTLLVGRDLDELDDLGSLVIRAIGLAAIPAAFIAMLGGALLAAQSQRRLGQAERITRQVMAGNLSERIPVSASRDTFGRLVSNVNMMLDRIETLVVEVRGVGDDIAHQLKTPLTRLRAGLERAILHSVGHDDLLVASEQAIREIDEAQEIIAALLRIREIEVSARTSHFRPLHVARVVRDAVELYAAKAEESRVMLSFETDIDPVIPCDADLLMEAIANLIDNAIKFSPAGGTVSVSLRQDGPRFALLRVADQGPGVPPGERSEVFHRFYRSARDNRVPGVGLGLSLVAAIATLHGIVVNFDDAAPGCIVIARLPLCSADRRLDEASVRAHPVIASGRPRLQAGRP